jgi:hypothetical protein
MFDLFIIALLQFATLTGTPTSSKIGGSGWDVDAVSKSKIGGSGWDVDAASTNSKIGGSGWDVD